MGEALTVKGTVAVSVDATKVREKEGEYVDDWSLILIVNAGI